MAATTANRMQSDMIKGMPDPISRSPLAALRHNASAWLIDLITTPAAKIRGQVLQHARGRVADIGIGGGGSLRHYPADVTEVHGIEPDPAEWLLRRRAGKLHEGIQFELVSASAEALPYEDHSLDTVTFQLVLCTIPDPVAALSEARRVLKPDGRLLFMEHLRHPDERVARFQDRLQPLWGRIAGGCRINQDTVTLLEQAGFDFAWKEHVVDRQRPRFLSHLAWGMATPLLR
ncbi:MAG: class I SAM-dependent methyltransferase [Candidatus Dadabacteria bacterium]|nr:MAG: class I SAM-dependent methyltransferase [Candidatus Dadabacteria bacterium]